MRYLGLIFILLLFTGCTGTQEESPEPEVVVVETNPPETAPTTTLKNYGDDYDAVDLFPSQRDYKWKDVPQDLERVQSIIGTGAEVVSHASKDFDINGVKGNLLIVEGKTGEDSEKAVSGYLDKGASWISYYEIQDDVSLGEGIEASRLLTLKDNGGTCTILWNGYTYAFFVYLSSSEANPYETGKLISEDILENHPFLYEKPTITEISSPEPTEQPVAQTKEEVSFKAIAVGGWSGSAKCGEMSIIDGYFICPGGKLRGGQTLNNLGFSIKGAWDIKEQVDSDGKHYNGITLDYTYTAQLDRSVTGKQKETWWYAENTDTLWLSSETCRLILQRVEGEVDMSDCELSYGGGGSDQCTADYQCGTCWYCDDGTCRYGGEGPSGCYRGYSDGYIKLENQWFPIS